MAWCQWLIHVVQSQVHHPLSEDQLEEVWEEQDHMDKDSFDPETFFRMHGQSLDDAAACNSVARNAVPARALLRNDV